MRIAAAVTARYSDAKRLPVVKVIVKKGERERSYEVAPAGDEELERVRRKVEEKLTAYSPQELRDFGDARKRTAISAMEILKEMDSKMGAAKYM